MLREERKNVDDYEVAEDDAGYRNNGNLHISVRIIGIGFGEN